MTALNKQALRGQSVEGSYYLAECGHCGEMYPSNKLDGGEPLFSGDYGECFCHLCGADDSDIADNGAWGSEAVIAWNYQQKRIEALLDELVAKDRLNAELIEKQRLIDICQGQGLEHRIAAEKRAEAAEKRIAELEAVREVFLRAKALMYQSGGAPIENSLNPIDAWLYDAERAAAGIGVKGE